jgi:hypothetical protein
LNLAGNRLGLEGAWEIGRAFGEGWGQELRSLSLASNGLGAGGVEALMEAARGGGGREGGREEGRRRGGKPFVYYHVREGGLSPWQQQQQQQRHDFASASYLATASLPSSSTSSSSSLPPSPPSSLPPSPLENLQTLDLFLNGAGDEGASELALSLAHGLLPSLLFLDLAANRISQEGVGGLVSVLEEGGGREGGRERRREGGREGVNVNLAFNLLPWEKESYAHAMPRGVRL